MSEKAQKPIVIFRGDNTAAFDLRTITILLTGDLDLTNATARFDLLGFTKSWTTEEVATGELSIVFDSAQTKAFALGPQMGTLRLFDMSTGTPRQLTVVNKIPFFITNNVCEIDSQSYGVNVRVTSGETIHIEFNVGLDAVEGKADKAEGATAGDLASLTEDGNLEDSGIPANDVQRKLTFDDTPTAGSQNPVTSDGIKQAIDAATPEDYDQVKSQVEQNTRDIATNTENISKNAGDIADNARDIAANTTDISTINGKIPAQSSAENQLADKDFVNSSIATNTATFRGSYNLVSDLGLTVSATEQQVAAAIATKLASLVPPVVPENNDYCFVQVPKTDADPTIIERVDRYKCTVTESGGVTTRVWGYEWSLNNSSFTADQWAAINSGITSGDVAKLGALPTAQELATALAAKYEKPNTGIPKTDLASVVQASLDKADSALQTAPVTSVNSKTGAVSLTANDIDYTVPGGAMSVQVELDSLESSKLGNTGDQTLNGNLTANNIDAQRVELYDNGLDAIGLAGNGLRNPNNDNVVIRWPALGSSDTLALLSDIYAAVQQIAPAWVSGTTYAADAKVSYNGVVYARKTSGSITSSTNPASDTTNWEAKKVSELFLPLTGGIVDGEIWANSLNVGFCHINSAMGGAGLVIGKTNSSDKLIFWAPEGGGMQRIATLTSIAPKYSASVTYALNELCVYSNALYRCTTAITTAEVWTAAHWTEATVEDVLAAIRSALDDKAPLASPAFTGTPTAPNLTDQSADGQVANKKYVDDKVAGVSVTPLSGQTFDFATMQGIFAGVKACIEALGGSVTNFPTIPVNE